MKINLFQRLIALIVGLLWYFFFIIITLTVVSVGFIPLLLSGGKAHKWAHLLGKIWGRLSIYFSFCTVRGYNQEIVRDLTAPFLIISNHQSFFDILLGLGFFPVNFIFLSKIEVFKVPIIGFYMKAAEYIPVDRSNPRKAATSVIKAIKKMKLGHNVLIYPEGSRNQNLNEMLPFEPGTLVIAGKGNIPILPIVTHGTGKVSPVIGSENIKQRKFFVLPRKLKYKVLPPIYPTEKLHPANKDGLSQEEQREGLRKMFEKAYKELDDL